MTLRHREGKLEKDFTNFVRESATESEPFEKLNTAQKLDNAGFRDNDEKKKTRNSPSVIKKKDKVSKFKC